MKPLLILALISISLTVAALAAQPDDVRITLEAATEIAAGDAWELAVLVDGANAGDTVKVVLFNGLATLEDHLTLDETGAVQWQIPAGRIIQAGTSVVFARYGDTSARLTLKVMARTVADADLFTTANTLPAYGAGDATLLFLPRDRWGNPLPNPSRFTGEVLFPGDETASFVYNYRSGLGWYVLESQGPPGRVRVSLAQETRLKTLELTQAPAAPADLTLAVSPECVLNDGRDVLLLTANVSDAHANPVADGTLVTFSWRDGVGYGRTIEGQAVLKLPAPLHSGYHAFAAQSGAVNSIAAILRVSERSCADD